MGARLRFVNATGFKPVDIDELVEGALGRCHELAPAQRYRTTRRHLREAAQGDSGKRSEASDKTRKSFYHLFHDGEHAGRDVEAERLGGLGVDDEFEFGGLLHRQVGGFSPLRMRPI